MLNAFGSKIDFAQLVKIYGIDYEDEITESTDARVKYKGAEKDHS